MDNGLVVRLSHVDGSKIADTSATSIDLGIITGVSITYSSSGSPSPVLLWGWKGAFMMDMGVSKAIHLDYNRVSPKEYHNNSSDSTEWTNAYWHKKFKEDLNTWQAKHFCYELKMTPLYSDQFISVDDIGFITSFSAPINAGNIYNISGTLDFKLGRISLSD